MQSNYLAYALKDSRKKAGKSQEFMAAEMDLSRRTIQNWEGGISAPTISQCLEWYEILDLSPLPYLFSYVHPIIETLKPKDDSDEIKAGLYELIETLPEEGLRQLFYILKGDHGSSPRGILNMVTAYLQTDMFSRVSICNLILTNYLLSAKKKTLTGSEDIQPNTDFIKFCIGKAEGAVEKNNDSYSDYEYNNMSEITYSNPK